MRFLNYLLLSLCVGNSSSVQEAKKPVTFRVLIAGKARMNVGVTWSKQHGQTNGKGEVTFQKSACEKRNKGEKVHLSILWQGRDSLYTFSLPDTVIVLDESTTEIHCKQEQLRKSEEAIQEKEAILTHLGKRNNALLEELKKLQTHVLDTLKVHPESLITYYESWLTLQIDSLKAFAPKIEKQQHDLAQLSNQALDNEIVKTDVDREEKETTQLKEANSPIQDTIEAITGEIRFNMNSGTEYTLKSYLLFGLGSDTLKPESTQALSEYAVQRKTQLIGIIEEERTRTKELRTRVCVVQLTGFADSFRMDPCVNKTNHTCKDVKDGNLCLSLRRANRVKDSMLPLLEREVVKPLKEQGMVVELQMQSAVGMGRKYALKDTTGNQDDWRKCTISMIYMSKSFFDQYVAAPQQLVRK